LTKTVPKQTILQEEFYAYITRNGVYITNKQQCILFGPNGPPDGIRALYPSDASPQQTGLLRLDKQELFKPEQMIVEGFFAQPDDLTENFTPFEVQQASTITPRLFKRIKTEFYQKLQTYYNRVQKVSKPYNLRINKAKDSTDRKIERIEKQNREEIQALKGRPNLEKIVRRFL